MTRLRWTALVALAACARTPPPPPPSPLAAATVDGVAIPLPLVQRELDRLRRPAPAGTTVEAAEVAAPPAFPDGGDLAQLGRAVLGPLIDRALLVARARKAGLSVPAAEVQKQLDALAESARAAGQSLAEHLAQDGETQADLAEETRDRLLAESWVSQQIRGLEKVTPTEVRAWYDTHKSELEQPEEVHAEQIVVASAEEAKSLLDQLRKPGGPSFEDLARAHSGSPDARRGGDLGWFPRGTMPPVFDETCFSLKTNAVSGVVASRYGFHLFKLLGRRRAHARSFEEAEGEIGRKLTIERQGQAERSLLAQLRAQAQIRINDAALAQLR